MTTLSEGFQARIKRDKDRPDICVIRMVIQHPMENGLRKDEQGNVISEQFIQEVTCRDDENLLFASAWGPSIASDPYLSFRLKDLQTGATLKISWVDNKGNSDTIELSVP